jgi:site-specific recombinase XerD
VQLFSVDKALVERYLQSEVLSGIEVAALLEHRGISDGTSIYLDDDTMLPVEPLNSWARSQSYADLDASTLREYGRIIARLDRHQRTRGGDLLSATESDLVSYRRLRTRQQRKPIGPSAWGKESGLIDRFYGFLVDHKHLERRPVRVAARGRNALSPRVRLGMDIRHMTFEQYRYFRDVGLGGQLPDASVNRSFRGWAPHRGRAGADLALGTGMRWREWATVLLPELGLGASAPGSAAEFTVQACAKYGKARTIYVPEDAIDSVETYCLLERPEMARAAAKTLGRKHRDLFVVSRIDHADGRVRGVQQGLEREYTMSAMPADLRRITVTEGEFGLEALTVFICRGGLMPGADSWKRYRHAAWRRMVDLADETTPRLPAKRWRWHDCRHTYALQLLTYLENLMDGEEPDHAARRRRHRSYLTGHIRYNPLLIVSRRLGHSSPETTYAYLEYTDDLIHEFEEAFRDWLGDSKATYAQIATHALGTGRSGSGVA